MVFLSDFGKSKGSKVWLYYFTVKKSKDDTPISNNELQFNAVNNYSMNLSTYQPQIDSEDEEEEEEEEEEVVEDMVVKNAVVVEAEKVEAKKRGRPPLTEAQKEKNAAKLAATKAAKRAKRAKKD